MNKKVMIIGIAGFVGSSVADRLLKEGFKIIGVDNFSYGYKNRIEDIIKDIDLIEEDFNDIRFDSINNIDVIINCAAIAPLPENQKDHFSSLKTNVALCGSIIDFACLNGINKIIHFSSSAVYENGISKNGIKASVSDELSPLLMYPVSKYLSEIYFESQAHLFDIDITSIRLFNLYGPKQDYFRKQPPLLGYLIKNLLTEKEITIFASKEAKRDYIFIDDLIDFIQIVINNENNVGQKIVNLGSGASYSVYEIIERLERVSGSKIAYKKGETKSFWGNYNQLFNRKIPLKENIIFNEINKMAKANIQLTKKNYNWNPQFELDEGLKECLDYAKEII